jgi:hypothetical protein
LQDRGYGYDLEVAIVQYTRENIAKVNIFLKDPYVQRYVREEKITEITFVGTVGGLLGLFLGFSFISVVEIAFMTIIWLRQKLRPSSAIVEPDRKAYQRSPIEKPKIFFPRYKNWKSSDTLTKY